MRLPVSYGTRAYVLVLALQVVGLAIVGFGPWRAGLMIMGGALVGAAIARVAVTERHLGMLKIRSRVFDIFWCTAVGAGLMLLAVIVPPPIP